MAKAKVLELETEEVTLTPEELQVVKKEINHTLVKSDITDKLIEKYEEEFLGLTVNGIGDKEGLELVYNSRQTVKNMRILVKRVCKFGRAALQAKSKAWIEAEKHYVTRLESIEAVLQKEEDKVEQEKNRIKFERQEAEKKRLITRTAQLTEMGVQFNGAEYVLDEVAYDLDVIKETEDEQWNKIIIPKYKVIFDEKEKIRIANAKAIADEKERQDKEKKDLEEREQKIKDDQKRLKDLEDKIELDRKKAIRERSRKRALDLEEIGFTYNFQTDKHELKSLEVEPQTIMDFSEEAWEKLVDEMIPEVERINKEIQAEKEQQQKIRDEQIRQKAIQDQKDKDENDRIKKQEEEDRATDKQKVHNFIKKINELEFPSVKSRHFREKLNIIREKFEEINQL